MKQDIQRRIQDYTLTELFYKAIFYKKEIEIEMEKHSPDFTVLESNYDFIKQAQHRLGVEI